MHSTEDTNCTLSSVKTAIGSSTVSGTLPGWKLSTLDLFFPCPFCILPLPSPRVVPVPKPTAACMLIILKCSLVTAEHPVVDIIFEVFDWNLVAFFYCWGEGGWRKPECSLRKAMCMCYICAYLCINTFMIVRRLIRQREKRKHLFLVFQHCFKDAQPP